MKNPRYTKEIEQMLACRFVAKRLLPFENKGIAWAKKLFIESYVDNFAVKFDENGKAI